MTTPASGARSPSDRAARSEAKPSEGGLPQDVPSEGGSAAQRPSKQGWTVLDLLRWTTRHFASKGIDTARLDAECLLGFALGVERMRLYLDFDKPVTEPERAAFRALVRRRGTERVPVAQLIGSKEFWSLPLRVGPEVLAPRPETETLVAAALELIPDPEAEIRLLDVGTGSGAVALALAHERPRARVTATDVSEAALGVARANAEALGMAARLRFLAGPGFEPVAGERFDLVVSNPPYLAEAERASLPPELAHEPAQALFAGPDGLAVLRELVDGVGARLAPGGAVALELAPEQASRVAGWCREAGLLSVMKHRDLAGRDRVVTARGGG
jgi:release factor glutamine methyltransferase